jgi:hypothetical protein
VGKGSRQFSNAMMAYLQQISDDLKQIEALRLDLKWCAQANGSDTFPIAIAFESDQP